MAKLSRQGSCLVFENSSAVKDKDLSKLLSLVLRHQPEYLNLDLEQGAWIELEKLIQAMQAKAMAVEYSDIVRVVQNNDKQRFAISDDGLKIRANQGHSVEVDLDLELCHPPESLYHGTAQKNLQSILSQGLKRMNRHHVHLSIDQEVAKQVGQRHGKILVFKVDSGRMHKEGVSFYSSRNGVWLCDYVDPVFLEIV